MRARSRIAMRKFEPLMTLVETCYRSSASHATSVLSRHMIRKVP